MRCKCRQVVTGSANISEKRDERNVSKRLWDCQLNVRVVDVLVGVVFEWNSTTGSNIFPSMF